MNQKIDVVTAQNPRNFTHQLQVRNENKILAKNLVKIKPMVDNKMPISYKSQKQKEQAQRARQGSVQTDQQAMDFSQSLYQNARSLENVSGLYQGSPEMLAYDPDFPPPDPNQEDPLYRMSTTDNNMVMDQNEMQQQQQYANGFGQGNKNGSQWQRGRGPNDSLLSSGNQPLQQQSIQNSQHQGGSVAMQNAMNQRHITRVERERKRKIDTDNAILLKKMMKIMNRKQGHEKGLVSISKNPSAQTGGEKVGQRGVRQAISVPEADPSSEMAPTMSNYMSDVSNRGLASRGGPRQQIMLAPKLNQSAAASAKPNQQPFMGAAISVYTGPLSGKTSNSQNRVAQNFFNGAGQQHLQQQYLANQSQFSSQAAAEMQLRHKSQLTAAPRAPGTLNFSTRKRQIEKINQENLQMLRTLQTTKPTISSDQWKAHARRQDCYKKNISLSTVGPTYQLSANAQHLLNPNSLSQTNQRKPRMPNMTIDHSSENPARQFMRAKVKSGCLPSRSNFYVHKPGTSSGGSKKAYSMSNYAGGGYRQRLNNIRSGANASPTVQVTQQQVQQPHFFSQQSPQHQIGSQEMTQKIESVINMFPQPTTDQLDEFKELQESEYNIKNSSMGQPSFTNEPHTITNINVYKNENLSDHPVDNYNLELMRSMQNQQIVSQPIVDSAVDENGIPVDARRVRTTHPGKRVRHQNPLTSLRAKEQVAPKTADQESHVPEHDPSLDMQNINQAQSMDNSMKSTSQAPQIIVRRTATAPNGVNNVYGQSDCNPMLVPMNPAGPFQQTQMQPNNPNMSFYPAQAYQQQQMYQTYPEDYNNTDQQQQMMMEMHQTSQLQQEMPKRGFFDYQYQDGPDYNISFDQRTGQPLVNNMDAAAMNTRLTEMQNEIATRMLDDNIQAKQNFNAQKEQGQVQRKRNVKQIMRAYAMNNKQGPYGTNNNLLNQLQNRKMPLYNRRNSRLANRINSTRPSEVTMYNNSQVNQTQEPGAVKRKLRATATSKSPPRKPANMNAKTGPPKFMMPPKTSHQATRPRMPNPPNELDDQVGGGPVSPEVLRLQNNRPDERQQRNRQKVYSPVEAEKEPDRKTDKDSSKSKSSKSNTAKPQPATEQAAPAKQQPQKFVSKPKPPVLQDQNEKAPIEPQACLSPEATQVKPHSLEGKTGSATDNSIGNIPVPDQVYPNTSKQSSQHSRINTSQDQRASSTIEEGIMGLQYLPPQASQTQDAQKKSQKTIAARNESPFDMTYGAQNIKLRESQELSGEQVISQEENENSQNNFVAGIEPGADQRPKSKISVEDQLESQKTKKLPDTVISPKVKEEDGGRRIVSTMEVHDQSLIEQGLPQSADLQSIGTSQTRKKHQMVTHQDTQVGLIQSNIQDQPIHVDMSDQYSGVTEQNRAEEGALAANRQEILRQSRGTDGAQNPYSDFEDDDQAAVGSGIVETEENYEDDDREVQDNYQDFHQITDSNDSQGKEVRQSENSGAGSQNDKTKNQKQPVGAIAQLVKQQQQSDDEIDESEYSDEVVPDDNGSTKLKGQDPNSDDDDDIDYEDDQFTDTQGASEMQKTKKQGKTAAPKSKQMIQGPHFVNHGDDDIEDESDYEEDFDQRASGSQKKRKMSLESDQEADENEFEQIKDEDYVEEDDEQSDKY